MSDTNPFDQHGKDYQPFLRVHRVPSKGICSRLLGRKTGRIHHTLSQLETSCLYILDFAPHVKDIREQFPLPLPQTQQIADALGVVHPRIPNERITTTIKNGQTKVTVERVMEPIVMTTDFLVTMNDDSLMAISVKDEQDRCRKRVQQKLQIEKRFWEGRGVPYTIATEQSINPHLAQNLRWIHSATKSDLSADDTQAAKVLLEEGLHSGMTLGQAGHLADERLMLLPGSGLQLARHLLCTKQWNTDLTQPITPAARLRIKVQDP